MLKAGPKQNGPWLEMNQSPSHLEAFILCQLHRGGEGVNPWLAKRPSSKGPNTIPKPYKLKVWMESQFVNKYHPKENWYVLRGQIFQATPVPILIGTELFKEGVSWKTWNPGPQSMEPPQRDSSAVQSKVAIPMIHSPPVGSDLLISEMTLLLCLLWLAYEHHESRDPLLSCSPVFPKQLDQWLAHSRCSVNIHWVHKSMSNLRRNILCPNPPQSSQQCYEMKSFSLLHNENIKAQRGCMFFPGPHT